MFLIFFIKKLIILNGAAAGSDSVEEGSHFPFSDYRTYISTSASNHCISSQKVRNLLQSVQSLAFSFFL